MRVTKEFIVILHASVTADDPKRSAETLALLLEGEAFPMGPGVGTWMAISTTSDCVVEVMKRGSEFHPVPREHVETRMGPPVRHTGFHLLIETPLSEAQVLKLAEQRGAMAHRSRHGFFDVIEFWIDDCLLVEVATPDLAEVYRNLATLENARAYTQLRSARLASTQGSIE
jgi:hypothetical protein